MPNSFDISDEILADFEKRLTKVIANFKRKILANLSGLDTASGTVTKTAFNIEYATALLPQLLSDLQDAGFDELIAGFLDDDTKLIKSLGSLTSVPIQFTQSSLQTITALQSAQIAGFNAIGERAMNTIREEVMRTVLTGSRIEDALTVISDSLESQFQRYAYTYANTALRDLMQLSIDEGVKQADAGEGYWEYVGPDDNVTRPACQELLSMQFFTDAEREEWDAATSEERAYNCRHAFVPITKEQYDNEQATLAEIF